MLGLATLPRKQWSCKKVLWRLHIATRLNHSFGSWGCPPPSSKVRLGIWFLLHLSSNFLFSVAIFAASLVVGCHASRCTKHCPLLLGIHRVPLLGHDIVLHSASKSVWFLTARFVPSSTKRWMNPGITSKESDFLWLHHLQGPDKWYGHLLCTAKVPLGSDCIHFPVLV